MADKKVIIVACGEAEVNGGGSSLAKFLKKACNIPSFANGAVAAEAAKVEGSAQVAADAAAKFFEDNGAFAVVELGNVDAAALDAAMAHVLEAADRRTLTVLATNAGLFLAGLGIDKKSDKLERSASVADIIATVCYVADLPVPADCTGAILYQALKDPNMKMIEIGKLKEALARMEVALQRDNREPWDKHDCA